MRSTVRPRHHRPRNVSTRALIAACVVTLPMATLHAAPLDPTAFPSLGTLNVSSGTLTINTDTLAVTGAASFTGITFDQGPLTQNGITDFDRTIAVFNFASVTIGSGVTINVTGSRPLALLSRSSMTIAAPIQLASGAAGGAPGGTNSATGGGPGGGRGAATVNGATTGGGGSFGGVGKAGFNQFGAPPAPTYGDLLSRLQGGSGGGSSPEGFGPTAGGGGGGALELGAVTSLSLSAPISAPGASVAISPTPSYAGAGSGGAILLHAPSLSFSSLSAYGGNSSTVGAPGGGGRVALVTTTLTPDQFTAYLSSVAVAVAGGATIGPGVPGAGGAGAVALRADTFAVPAGQSITLPAPAPASGRTSPALTLSVAALSVPLGATASYSVSQFLDPASGSADVNGTLVLGPYSQTLRAVTGTGPVSFAGGTLSLGAGNLSSTLSNPLTGTGTLAKVGAGALTVVKGGPGVTLSVSAGSLIVNSSVLDTPSFSVAPGATLRVTNNGRLVVNGAGTTATNAGTVVVDDSATLDAANPLTNSGTITGRDAFFRFTGGLSNAGLFEAGSARDVYGPVSNLPGGTVTVSGGANTSFHSLLNAAANSSLSVATASTLFLSGGVTGTGSLVNSGTTRIEAGPSTLASVTGGGTLTVTAPVALTVNSLIQSSVTIQGTITLNPNGGPSQVSTLSIPTGGLLDINNNPLAFDYTGPSPLDAVRQHLLATRIRSTTATSDPQHRFALAYAEASALPLSRRNTVAGLPVDDTAVLVKLTYLGDANLDGTLNADDYALLDRSYAKSLTGARWTDGDFNYDGQITTADYLLIDSTYLQQQGGTPSPTFLSRRESQFGSAYVSQLLTSVPEPSSLLAIVGVVFVGFRKRI